VLAFQSSFVTPDRLPALASSDGRAGWRIALMGMSGSGKSTPAIIAGPPRPRPGAYAWVAGPARSRPPSGWQASVR
jgi:ABC-type thiamine transport system ATPase subunit